MSSPHGHAGVILSELAAGLRRRGVGALYGAAAGGYGVLSVGPGLSVWCDGQSLWWFRDGERTTRPANDTEGAVAELQKLVAEEAE